MSFCPAPEAATAVDPGVARRPVTDPCTGSVTPPATGGSVDSAAPVGSVTPGGSVAAVASVGSTHPGLVEPPADRHARGLRALAAIDGERGLDVVRRLEASFPAFARYLVEFPFGDIYSRPALGLRERELATVAALVTLGSAAPQLKVHVGAALEVGCTPTEIVEVVMQMAVYAGFPAALNGLAVTRDVFAEAGIDLPLADANQSGG